MMSCLSYLHVLDGNNKLQTYAKSRLFQYYNNSFHHYLIRKKLYLFNALTFTEENNNLSQCQFKKPVGGKTIVLPEAKFRVVNFKQTRKVFIMC